MDSPLSRAVIRATQRGARRSSIVALPTLGGSLPMHAFEEVLHAPLIVLPIVNHDNNQHSSNENLRMQNLFDGIDVYAGVRGSVVLDRGGSGSHLDGAGASAVEDGAASFKVREASGSISASLLRMTAGRPAPGVGIAILPPSIVAPTYGSSASNAAPSKSA